MLIRSMLIFMLLLSCATLAACGGDSVSETGSDDGAAGELRHVDGLVSVEGKELVVDQDEDGAPVRMQIGPEIKQGKLAAAASSGQRVRVFYTGEDDPVVAKIETTAQLGEEIDSYEGEVAKVEDDSVTIDGDDGERTFTVSKENAADVPLSHLREHQQEGERVKIYYEPGDGADQAVSFEDA